MRVTATVLGSDDPGALASFYERLLGWQRIRDEPGWIMLRSPDGIQGLSFQFESTHEPPQWPPQPGRQQMMAHLDVVVDELGPAVVWASRLGATAATSQPQDHVRVMFDPAGHPFCLYVDDGTA